MRERHGYSNHRYLAVMCAVGDTGWAQGLCAGVVALRIILGFKVWQLVSGEISKLESGYAISEWL